MKTIFLFIAVLFLLLGALCVLLCIISNYKWLSYTGKTTAKVIGLTTVCYGTSCSESFFFRPVIKFPYSGKEYTVKGLPEYYSKDNIPEKYTEGKYLDVYFNTVNPNHNTLLKPTALDWGTSKLAIIALIGGFIFLNFVLEVM